MQIGAIALEELVVRQRQENIEIAGRATADAGLAFTGEPDPRAVFDALRDVDRQGAVARHPSRSCAGRTGVFDHLAAALAAGAGPLQREETLGLPHPPLPASHRPGLWLVAGLRPAAPPPLHPDQHPT